MVCNRVPLLKSDIPTPVRDFDVPLELVGDDNGRGVFIHCGDLLTTPERRVDVFIGSIGDDTALFNGVVGAVGFGMEDGEFSDLGVREGEFGFLF